MEHEDLICTVAEIAQPEGNWDGFVDTNYIGLDLYLDAKRLGTILVHDRAMKFI